MNHIVIAALFAAAASFAGPSVAAAQSVPVTLSEWKVELGRDTVHAGSVTFNVKNAGTMTHGFYVRGPGVAKGAPDLPVGQETHLTVVLKPGTYEIYCPAADLSHRAAGMTHKLVVIGATPKP